MCSTAQPALLAGIDGLLAVFGSVQPLADKDVVELDKDALEGILKQLRVVRHLAFLNERELGAFRLLEAGRFTRGTIEEVVTGAAGELVLDPEGKVIRPDFGRRQ